MSTLLHVIFQRHHIPPDEFMRKDKASRAFMLASMKIQLETEAERRQG